MENQPDPVPAPPLVASNPAGKVLGRSLLSLCFRHIKPNWHHYIDWVDLAAREGDEAMTRFRDAYLRLTFKERSTWMPEQIYDLVGIEPDVLYGKVCQTMFKAGAAECSIISSLGQPELLQRTLKFAMKEKNYADRELLFRSFGILPDRKGASINIYNSSSAEAKAVQLASELTGGRLCSFDEEIIDMSRQLDQPAEPPFLVRNEDVPPDGN